jgi:hypothetical protein
MFETGEEWRGFEDLAMFQDPVRKQARSGWIGGRTVPI